MNSSEIIKIVSKRVGKINRLDQTVAEGFAMEEIRLFRIEIKKMRAFLRLCRAADIGHLRLPLSIERFYTGTGAIRDLQLQLQRTADFFSTESDRPVGYIGLLKRELEISKKAAAAARFSPAGELRDNGVSQDNRSSRGNGEAGGMDAGDPEDDTIGAGLLDKPAIRKYIQEKQRLLTKALKKEPEDEALHRLRKLLKDIRYNQQIVETVWKRPVPGLPERGTIREMTLLLGAHQDLSIALHYTRDEFTESLSPAERHCLDNMRRWLYGEKARVHREIAGKLDQLRPRLH